MKVQIILFDGFDELDAIAPYEVLENAASLGADLQVEMVTLADARIVTASHGLRLEPDAKLAIEAKPDILLVPGGNWNNRGTQGTRVEAERGDIPQTIAQLHQAGTLIAGVCTGAMLIAAAGILQARSAITHHGAIEDLRATGANIVQARVVDDGNIVTAGGVTSGLDLALWLVERFFGSQLAHQVERRMEYERRGTVWRAS